MKNLSYSKLLMKLSYDMRKWPLLSMQTFKAQIILDVHTFGSTLVVGLQNRLIWKNILINREGLIRLQLQSSSYEGYPDKYFSYLSIYFWYTFSALGKMLVQWVFYTLL